MKRLLLAAGLALAACASTAATPPPVEAGPDDCKASQYQWLVGRNRSEIPTMPGGERWRIACTECPVTMDYSPRRLNIFFDKNTEIIKQVRCG